MTYLAPGPPLEIREASPHKGRGVFTVNALPARTLVHVSPILLFPSSEYEAHGKFTRLDHYTYRWPGGMALALGLGSIFNHSRLPNVGFIRDVGQSVIRYVTLRNVAAEEELCISYGKRVWFEEESSDVGVVDEKLEQQHHEVETADGFLRSFGLMHEESGEHPDVADEGTSECGTEKGKL